MKSDKGFSLIEIIIAIALLGIISVGMLSAMTSQYSLIRRTRGMTENLFKAQELIENDIESVKQSIKNGTTPVGTRTAYTLFSGVNERTVYGYVNIVETTNTTGKLQIYAVAPEMKPLEFDVPAVNTVKIDFSNGAVIPYAYTSTPAVIAKATYVKDDPKGVFLMGINRWYVSRAGFNIPNILDPLKKFEVEKGTVYPRFPEDYTLIPGATLKDLSSLLPTYAGRHLIYTITPAATSGKMGTTEVSNSIFVSGLPVTSNLVLHLDASMISIEDSTSAYEYPANSGTYYCKQWNDISGQGFKALQSTTSKQPELIMTKMGNVLISGKEVETYAKYLRFSGGQAMTVDDDNRLDIDNLTVFAVMRSTDVTQDMTVVSKIRNLTNEMDTWHLGWDKGDESNPASDNKLAFYVRSNNNTRISTAVGDPGEGLDGKWHILTGTSQYDTNVSLSKTTLQIDDGTIYEDARPFSNSIVNNTPITIGYDGGSNYSNADIAEIIVYNGKLSDTDIALVQKYLSDKYQPIPPVISIYALKTIKDTVVKDSVYTLPTQIQAYMSNSTIQDVDVTWAPSTTSMDTSVIGKFTNTATSVDNPSKTMTLELDVVEIESLYNIEVDVFENDTFTLPTQVSAKLDNGINKDVDVTWDDNTVVTSVVGQIIRTGTAVLDTSKSMIIKVNIIPVNVSGIALNKSSTTMRKNQTETLSATITPSNASNKTVAWSSDNPLVATVSNTGVVTAIESGTARITATTVDGNLSGSCDVIVQKTVQEVMDGITVLTVTNPTNRNNQTRPIVVLPTAQEGVSFSFYSTSSASNFSTSTGTITRNYDTNMLTITVTLRGTADGVTVDKVFDIVIPGNSLPSSSRTITVTIH